MIMNNYYFYFLMGPGGWPKPVMAQRSLYSSTITAAATMNGKTKPTGDSFGSPEGPAGSLLGL